MCQDGIKGSDEVAEATGNIRRDCHSKAGTHTSPFTDETEAALDPETLATREKTGGKIDNNNQQILQW